MMEALTRLTAELGEEIRSRFYGKYRGIVLDNDDPKNLGRLTARVPAVLLDKPSPWALPCAPYAGDGLGLYAVPPVGSGVWIEFEAGDASRPIWTGCWWGDNQLPADEEGTDAKPPLKIWRTEKGLMLAMDDDAQRISLSDENGDNLLTIQVQQKEIKIQAQAKVVVEAPKIELVEDSTHPLVFGDDLLQYLNQIVTLYQTHTHPGETVIGIPVTPAPPVPPFQPPSPSMLSLKVTTG
jgi:hypothetical protein